MGYRLDLKIEKEYIDTWLNGDEFHSEIIVSGSSITDTISLEQDGVTVWFTVKQFTEFVDKLKMSSFGREVGIT